MRIFRRIHLKSCIVLCGLALAGCTDHGLLSTTQSITPTEANPEGFTPWTDTRPEYHLNPGDRIRVQFLLTPELAEEAIIAPDGTLALRAAGQINAQNMTIAQLQDAVTKASSKMLNNPVVTVSVVEAAGARVFVGGSVTKPGAYPIDTSRGALEAIVLAGGFDRESRADEVVLIRRDPHNKPMLRTVDLRGFISNGFSTGDVPLYAGDIVYVPRNRISEIDLWMEQFVTKFVPFNRSFDYSITKGTGAAALF